MSDSNGLNPLSMKLTHARRMLGDPAQSGTMVMKVGRIARPKWNIRTTPAPGAAAFSQLKLNDVVFVERSMTDRPGDKLSWLYVYAMPEDGNDVVEGWVRSDGVFLDPPEPEAKLKYITAQEKLINIAADAYKGDGFKWGDDARFYVTALAYVNRNYGALIFPPGWTDANFKDRDAFEKIQIKADHAIWIPSKEFLQQLKGTFVSSGSITYELWMKVRKAAEKLWEMVVGAVAFAAGLVHGALLSIYDALADLVELAQMIWKVLKSIFTFEIVKDAKKLWNQLKKLDLRAAMTNIANDFMAKWEADSTWDRFYFQGKVVGYIMGTAALAFLTAGATAAASVAAKGSKLARIIMALMNNPVVKGILETGAVKTVMKKAEAAIDKAADLKAKINAWKASKLDNALFRGLRLTKGYDSRMGIPEEHFAAMVDAAKETQSIAIFRANKPKAKDLIRKGAHGKPMWAKWKSDPETNLLTARNVGEAAAANMNGHYVVDVDGIAKRVVNGKTETMKLDRPFWDVKQGQVIAPDGKPIVGDYDLLGVAPIKSPGQNINVVPDNVEFGDWTGPAVEKYKAAVNRKGRLDEPRVLHGAQDGYGGNPKYMGLTDDTAYAVFPDGRTYIMEGKAAQQQFYDAIGRQAKQPGAPVGRPGWHTEGDRVVR